MAFRITRKVLVSLLACVLVFMMLFSYACEKKPEDYAIEIKFWHSYVGKQSQELADMISVYNETIAHKKNVHITAYYQGNKEELSGLLQSMDTDELPNIIVSNGDGAYNAYLSGKIVSASDYLSQSDLAKYADGVLNSGRFTTNSGVYLLPIAAKSSLLYASNTYLTDYLQSGSKHTVHSLDTWESIESLAEEYYNATGRAFIGISNVAELVFTLSNQYGSSIIQPAHKGININLNEDILRKIWNFYYAGVVKGYIANPKMDAGELLSNGDIVCYTGDISDAWKTPLTFTDGDETKDTNMGVYVYPHADGGLETVPITTDSVAVVDKSDDANREAFEFLNWLNNYESVYRFTTTLHALPVSKNIISSEPALDGLEDIISIEGVKRDVPNIYLTAYYEMYCVKLYSTTSFVGSSSFMAEVGESLENIAIESRENVLTAIDSGASYEEAVKSELDKDLFTLWVGKLEKLKSTY